jgi:recombination protein RecA
VLFFRYTVFKLLYYIFRENKILLRSTQLTVNKVAVPFKSCAVELIYGKGIAKDKEILDLATQFEIIKKPGSWVSI